MAFLDPEWHDRLGSTNTELLSRLSEGRPVPSGFVLAVREQTGGRGRFDRRWVSRPGRDLAFSFLIVADVDRVRLSSVTMATALGVAEGLAAFGVQAQVKWPNDLLAGGCKICGILAERPEGRAGPGEAVVVGVGVNVNMEGPEAAGIDRPATSILIETGVTHPVASVLDGILGRLPAWIERWEAGGFPALHDAWFSRHAGIGETVDVRVGDQAYSGVLAGFGEAGQLLLRGEDGTTREVWAGEVGLP